LAGGISTLAALPEGGADRGRLLDSASDFRETPAMMESSTAAVVILGSGGGGGFGRWEFWPSTTQAVRQAGCAALQKEEVTAGRAALPEGVSVVRQAGCAGLQEEAVTAGRAALPEGASEP